jgi:hypothetical protein
MRIIFNLHLFWTILTFIEHNRIQLTYIIHIMTKLMTFIDEIQH